MFSSKKRDAKEDLLDEIGEEMVRAARANDGDIETAASSPLLYSRIRASIQARERESEGLAGGWVNLLRAAKLAVPAMAVVMLVVICLPRLEMNAKARRHSTSTVGSAVVPPPYHQGDSSIFRYQGREPSILTFAAGTCALSNTQKCAISNNEVLATLFADDNQEKQR